MIDKRPARSEFRSSTNSDSVDEQIRYWGDQRLLETYHRLSWDIQHRVIDNRTMHRMGLVEEELRDRDIDPERVIQDLWE